MAKTKIEWADYTFNPWLGCTKVSPACSNCYAEGWAKRSGLVEWGKGRDRRRTTEAYWRQPLKWNEQAKATGARPRVFCASLADVFDEEVPRQWRVELFNLIAETQNLDWLLLTKRPENFAEFLPWGVGGHPFPNVWLGVTVENQQYANRRLPELLKIPAVVRFLSMEPLLGPVTIRDYLPHNPRLFSERNDFKPFVDWVIAGGESGPGARPSHPDWFRSIRDQCQTDGVAFHFKQHGDWYPMTRNVQSRMRLFGDPLWHIWPDEGEESTVSKRVGKKIAGRLLDLRTWDELPAPRRIEI